MNDVMNKSIVIFLIIIGYMLVFTTLTYLFSSENMRGGYNASIQIRQVLLLMIAAEIAVYLLSNRIATYCVVVYFTLFCVVFMIRIYTVLVLVIPIISDYFVVQDSTYKVLSSVFFHAQFFDKEDIVFLLVPFTSGYK